MEEEMTSFQTAKFAKEKGFPQDMFNCRWYNAFGTFLGRTDLNKDGVYVCESGYFQTKEERLNNVSDRYSAPTQALLQRYLRDVHNIEVNANVNFYNKSEKLGYYYTIDKFDVNNIHDGVDYDFEQIDLIGDRKGFSKYEEALEVGLFEALKLI